MCLVAIQIGRKHIFPLIEFIRLHSFVYAFTSYLCICIIHRHSLSINIHYVQKFSSLLSIFFSHSTHVVVGFLYITEMLIEFPLRVLFSVVLHSQHKYILPFSFSSPKLYQIYNELLLICGSKTCKVKLFFCKAVEKSCD